jgi:antitoxin MazE
MKAKIVKIGNSRGIRIPKPLIEEVGLADIVDLRVVAGEIVICPVESARVGWAEAARSLSTRGGDGLLDESSPTKFDQEEWEW